MTKLRTGDRVRVEFEGVVVSNRDGVGLRLKTEDNTEIYVNREWCTRLAPRPEDAPTGAIWIHEPTGASAVKIGPDTWVSVRTEPTTEQVLTWEDYAIAAGGFRPKES